MHSLFLNDVLLLGLTEAEVLFHGIIGFVTILILAGLALTYIYCRPLLPARVNCWFCNNNLWVPFAERNSFDCRICNQYNGFTSDGDYNKDIIPETASKERESKDAAKTNGLCQTCNINQQLKIQQLACFVPINENNYDSEIDSYRKQLEKAYRLCDQCNLVLTQTLQSQYYDLLTQRLNGHCPSGEILPPSQLNLSASRKFISSICIVISRSTAVLLLLISSFSSFAESQWLLDLYPMVDIETPKLLLTITLVGSISCLVSMFVARKFERKHIIQMTLWGIMLSMSYTAHLPGLIILSSMSALSNITWRKSSIKKPSQALPSKPVASIPVATKMHEPSATPKNLIVTSNSQKKSLSEVVQTSSRAIVTAEQAPAPTLEAALQKSVIADATVSSGRQPVVMTRSQKKKENSLQVDVLQEAKLREQHRSRRSRSPTSEVFRGMNSLRLGSPEPDVIPRKPANYLFEKLNFETKAKKNTNILRPSKFNTPSLDRRDSYSPKVWSSTPSSNVAFTDLDGSAVSPMPCMGNYTPPMAYSYDYDCPFTSSMAFGPPLGQATMYTYSRPSPYHGFPASYAPAHGSPCDCPMSPQSDGASSSLSQTSNATQPAHNYWDWVKRTANVIHFGVNLVILTVVILSYLRN